MWKFYSDPNFRNLASKWIGFPVCNGANVSIWYYYEFTPNIISGISSVDSVGSIFI